MAIGNKAQFLSDSLPTVSYKSDTIILKRNKTISYLYFTVKLFLIFFMYMTPVSFEFITIAANVAKVNQVICF